MGDINNAAALAAQFINNAEKMFHFRFRQGGGRFIQNNHFCIARNSLRDFYHLPFRQRQLADFYARVNIQFNFLKNGTGPVIHGFIVNNDTLFGHTADPDILHNRNFRHLIELLVYHRYSIIQCMARIIKPHRFALKDNLSAIQNIYSEQTFH